MAQGEQCEESHRPASEDDGRGTTRRRRPPCQEDQLIFQPTSFHLLKLFQFFDFFFFFKLELFASVCPALLWFCLAPAVLSPGLAWGQCDSGTWGWGSALLSPEAHSSSPHNHKAMGPSLKLRGNRIYIQ